jgi:hypothetical protein
MRSIKADVCMVADLWDTDCGVRDIMATEPETLAHHFTEAIPIEPAIEY